LTDERIDDPFWINEPIDDPDRNGQMDQTDRSKKNPFQSDQMPTLHKMKKKQNFIFIF
jgi:hypothetical protein